MKNVIRKELRNIQMKLSVLEKYVSPAEKMWIQNARIAIVQADYHEFHLNPKKKYVEPKSNFKYDSKYEIK